MTNGTEDDPAIWESKTSWSNEIQTDDAFEAKVVTLTEAEAIQLTAFATTLRELIK